MMFFMCFVCLSIGFLTFLLFGNTEKCDQLKEQTHSPPTPCAQAHEHQILGFETYGWVIMTLTRLESNSHSIRSENVLR